MFRPRGVIPRPLPSLVHNDVARALASRGCSAAPAVAAAVRHGPISTLLPHGAGFGFGLGLVPTAGLAALQQTRGAKTKTTVSLCDLPQGVIPAEPLPALDPVAADAAEPAYPTVVLQARRNMQKFSNCVLLTRVGGFYELYFEHADEYGPLLNLKVGSKKTSAGPVPMVGAIANTPLIPMLG